MYVADNNKTYLGLRAERPTFLFAFNNIYSFHSYTMHLDVIKIFYLSTDAK